ncbi:MAG: two-component regulator propeller domain-containing protein [Paludibacter sp.]
MTLFKQRLLICILCLVIGKSDYIQAIDRTFLFENLNMHDGLSINSVIRTFQDKEGFLWICTRDGLNKYDGSRFRAYRFDRNDPNSLSSNDVNSLAEDRFGNMWVGTYNGLNCINKKNGEILKFYSQNNSSSLPINTVKNLLIDQNNRLWVGSNFGMSYYIEKSKSFRTIKRGYPVIAAVEVKKGIILFAELNSLYIYNCNNEKLERYKLPGSHTVNTIIKGSDGTYWIGTNKSGLLTFDYSTKNFAQIDLRDKSGKTYNNHIDAIIELDQKKGLLISGLSGLLLYDLYGDKSTYNLQVEAEINGLSDNRIVWMSKDNSGGIWLSTWSSGLFYMNPNYNYFKTYSIPQRIQFEKTSITSAVYSQNKLWLSSNKGLVKYDFGLNKYSFYGNQRIERMYKQNDGNLLISISTLGVTAFNTSSCNWTEQLQLPLKTYVKGISEDINGDLWVAPNTGECFGKYLKNSKIYDEGLEIRNGKRLKLYTSSCVLDDKKQFLWIGTRNEGVYKYDFLYKTYQNYRVETSKTGNLPLNNISTIFEDDKYQIWIGTFGGGLCKYNATKNNFEIFDSNNGLSNQVIYGIQQDNNKNIWVSTIDGVSKLDMLTNQFINYNNTNGFKIGNVSENSFVKNSKGEFFVGGSEGFISFNPLKLAINKNKSKVVIDLVSYWQLNQNKVYYNKEIWMDNQQEINLSYKIPAFTVHFSSLNYLYSKQNKYAYKIKEIDDEWKYLGNTNHLNFNNLAYGKYTLLVKSANNDGIWNNTPTSLIIRIDPPFWWTWYSKLIYTLFALSLIFIFLRYYLNKKKLENDIKIKQAEKKNLEEVFQTRMRLFTNFSHELRTPLTLIIGPVHNLLKNESFNNEVLNILNLLNKNANRLLLLVNQLMDFRKLEEGNLILRCNNYPFQKFINDIYEAFSQIAKERDINFTLQNNYDGDDFWYDISKLEKVMMNLLSNAFKHTLQDGTVTINTVHRERNELKKIYGNKIDSLPINVMDFIEITVTDNGIGVPEENIQKLFDPFYQAHNYESSSIYGSGVGLNLTKGLVELQRGTIWAESIPSVETTFHVILPLGKAHLSSSEIDEQKIENEVSDFRRSLTIVSNTSGLTSLSVNSKLIKKYSLLVIDDNSELRNFISEVFIKDFIVHQADNGIAGLKLAKSLSPDLIISDVIMPGLNGFELCKEIKSNYETSHIPVILLTARAAEDDYKLGFEEGADEYISKPFNVDLLASRVRNILRNREVLREVFANKILVQGFEATESESPDTKFMRKVYDYVKSNIDNPDLKIDKFADDIGIDRTQLYRKIKYLTDLSPSRLVMTIRIHTAAEMLKSGNVTISDACYQVGFNDLSYFGKCFKMIYDISPTEFVKGK